MRQRQIPPAMLLLLAALGAQAAEPESRDEPAPDPRVEAALTSAKLAYIVDEGDFRLKYDVAGGRSQLVWVASGTAKLDQLEIRDVWSIASRGKGTPPAELASYLLKENARMILGAWQVNQGPEEYLVVFSAPVVATADSATLQEVIEVVMLSSDRIENELTGKDEF